MEREGIKMSEAHNDHSKDPTTHQPKTLKLELKAVVDGEIIPIEEVKDQLFSQKIIGDGYAIFPTGKKIYAPVDARIEEMASTKHAVYLSTAENVKLLIHVGIDTIGLKGTGFESSYEKGMQVKEGDVLIEFDPQFLIDEGYNPIVTVVVLNSTDGNAELEYFPQKEAIGNETTALKAIIQRG